MSEEQIHDISSNTIKPALKKNSQFNTPSTTTTTAITTRTNTNANSSSKHLSWDENAIEEHDQLRGTRMKVSTLHLHIHIN